MFLCSSAQLWKARRSDWRYRRIAARVVAIALCLLFQTTIVNAIPSPVRLRFAWGGNSQAPQRWTGRIAVDAGAISNLQPLGLQPDEPGALLLIDNGLCIAPQSKRIFDWCDLTITAEPSAEVLVELRSDPLVEPLVFRIPLSQLASEPFRTELDTRGNILLIHRAPGDKLAISMDRDALIFDPGEMWELKLHPDLAEEVKQGEIHIGARLHAQQSDTQQSNTLRSETVLWESEHVFKPSDDARPSIPLAVPCPAEEGVYRLTITASRPQGFASRLVPGKKPEVLASREVELVVVDPAAKLQLLTDRWLPMLSLDPANPSWWKRLPTWAKFTRLPGMSPDALGNVRPVVRLHPEGDLVELPAVAEGSEPAWQAYALPVKSLGEPHLIEIEYPANVPLNMSISIIEPDAAGRVLSSDREAGIYSEANNSSDDATIATHRFVFWPRTSSPLLLIANRHPSEPALYGKITLLQQDATNQEEFSDKTGSDAVADSSRLVAAYIARPTFAENFGAAEKLDPGSGLSVDSWSTFLEGSKRLAKHVRYRGQNGVFVSVAADGGALYPSARLGSSPRYDTGMLATTAPDPIRKDVLELLLRIADREGLRIIPTLQLASPLPQLEALRLRNSDCGIRIADCGDYGFRNPQSAIRNPYNPLNRNVQAELELILAELADRYSHHPSMAGVAIQLSSQGVTMLPGLAWGLDDPTVQRFSQDTGIAIAGDGPRRFRHRAKQLLGEHRDAWQQWRADQLTALYRRLGERLRQGREDLQLVLTTEEVFAGETAQRQLRQAVAEKTALDQVLFDHGIDLQGLSDLEGVTVLRPYRLAAAEPLARNRLDLHINRAGEIDQSLLENPGAAGLFYHLADRVRLPSFDAQSPFGEDRTHLTLTAQNAPAGAAACRQLVTMLARHDARSLVEGGALIPLETRAASQNIFRTFRQLPADAIDGKTLTKQPLTVRIYREAESTTVCLMNESPWGVKVDLPLNCREASAWTKLGDAPARSGDGDQTIGLPNTEGTLEAGSQTWPVGLAPYDLVAWRIDSADLQIGEPNIRVESAADEYLAKRIEAIEIRTSNLDIRRPYHQLLNPGFELEDARSAIVGWQPQSGDGSSVELDLVTKHSGRRSLHMKSNDATGVALQSNSFAMPETGQLVLSAYVRAGQTGEQTRLHIALEDDADGRTFRQIAMLDFAAMRREQPPADDWSQYEFSVDDIPFDPNGQMRVQFYLSGQGEVWIDDVELCDLQFVESERVDLVKRMVAARRALDQGRLMDCLRLVDDFGPRFLVEYVPPAAVSSERLAKSRQPPVAEKKTEEHQGFGQRVKGLMPKLWR